MADPPVPSFDRSDVNIPLEKPGPVAKIVIPKIQYRTGTRPQTGRRVGDLG